MGSDHTTPAPVFSQGRRRPQGLHGRWAHRPPSLLPPRTAGGAKAILTLHPTWAVLRGSS